MSRVIQTVPVSRSAGSHLSDQAIARIEEVLRDDLAVQRAHAAEHEQAIDDAAYHERPGFHDIIDRATAEGLLRRVEQVIADIEHALRRINDGTYGCCELCGRPIPFERLEAIPEARACVPCQSWVSSGPIIR